MGNYIWTWCHKCFDRTDHVFVEMVGWMCIYCHTKNTTLLNPSVVEKGEEMSTQQKAELLLKEGNDLITSDMGRAEIFSRLSGFCNESEVIDEAISLIERQRYDDAVKNSGS